MLRSKRSLDGGDHLTFRAPAAFFHLVQQENPSHGHQASAFSLCPSTHLPSKVLLGYLHVILHGAALGRGQLDERGGVLRLHALLDEVILRKHGREQNNKTALGHTQEKNEA